MATAEHDYYELLGVSRDADDRVIRDAFRALALKYHPDRNKEPGAEDRFKEIASAYAVLSDPQKRKQYDEHGFAGVAGIPETEMFRGVDFGDLFGGVFGGRSRSGDLFERFFGARRRGPARGRDLEVELEIPLARVMTGGTEKIASPRSSACHACCGTGAKDTTRIRRCSTCQGTGQTAKEDARMLGTREIRVRNIITCPACGGRGEIVDELCPVCGGRRVIDEPQSLSVEIPSGVEDGMVLRIPGHGMPSEEAGGTAGDLHLVVGIVPDLRFERRGSDLWRHETISVPEAVLGTKRTIEALDDTAVELTVPPGAQPGLALRVAGKGLPSLGGDRRGDLYVRFDVRIPDHPSPRERELYEELRAVGDGPRTRQVREA